MPAPIAHLKLSHNGVKHEKTCVSIIHIYHTKSFLKSCSTGQNIDLKMLKTLEKCDMIITRNKQKEHLMSELVFAFIFILSPFIIYFAIGGSIRFMFSLAKKRKEKIYKNLEAKALND